MRNQTKTTFDGLLRIDSNDYADVALKEVLQNAIIHRDCSNLTETIISVYADQMEFVSYGGLSGGVTLEDVLYGLSMCRNRKFADIFYHLKLIKTYETGLQRIQSSYEGKIAPPSFETGPSSFKVVLPNRNVSVNNTDVESLDTEDQKIIDFISKKEIS